MHWADPTEDRARFIASNLRKEDRHEVQLSHAISGAEAVLTSWASSEICRCIETSNGEPVGLTGVCGDRIWLLGTEGLTATKGRRLQLCAQGRLWVEYCLQQVGAPIGNDAFYGNRASIRWLKHLGFHVEQPRPMGPSSALFCRFWREP